MTYRPRLSTEFITGMQVLAHTRGAYWLAKLPTFLVLAAFWLGWAAGGLWGMLR